LQVARQDCLFAFVAQVARKNSDSPDVIAKASFSVCLQREHAVFEAMANADGRKFWRHFVADEVFPAVRETMQDKLVAAVLVARAAPAPRPFMNTGRP